jgi:HD-GYP domain-containing protein (c-di-GMP phosphodiesterase class II)
VNDVALVGVLSLAQSRPIRETWRAVAGRTLVDDILVAPVVGFLAYAVVMWGFLATIVIAATLVWVHKLYQTNQALTRLSSELLEMMVTAIEARDPYTSGHSRRVSRMGMEIARSMGLPERTVARIGVAGLLHDVGKIHEKYASILQKPDRLTKDEWLLMKEHPADGEALVAKVSALHDILPAVRHHHERWDGGGYPDGLRGDAIPVMARVLTFADTIDAMTSTRPYRRGLTQQEVHDEILRCAGQQFDPTIAKTLLASPAWHTLIQPVEADTARYGLRLVPETATEPSLAASK